MKQERKAKRDFRLFRHPEPPHTRLVLDGKSGDHAKAYQERLLRSAVEKQAGTEAEPEKASSDKSSASIRRRSNKSLSKSLSLNDLQLSRYRIVIEWSDEDQVFLAEIPELPGLKIHASSAAGAADRAIKIGKKLLKDMRRFGDPIPAPKQLLSKE